MVNNAQNIEYVGLFVETSGHKNYDPYLTREIILDMCSYSNIVFRRIERENCKELVIIQNGLIYIKDRILQNLDQTDDVKTKEVYV